MIPSEGAVPNVTLEFKGGSTFPLSQKDLKLLASESPYFKKISESKSDIKVPIDVNSLDDFCFEMLLEILNGAVEINQDTFLNVLLVLSQAAHKFKIKKLSDLLCPILETKLSLYLNNNIFGTICRFHCHLLQIDDVVNTKFHKTLGKFYGKYLASLKPGDVANAIQMLKDTQVQHFHFDFSDTNIKDKLLEALQGLSIKTLILKNCTLITDKGLSYLKDQPLQKLDLHNCSQITDEGMGYLKDMPLTSLDLWNCNKITDAGIAHLKDKWMVSLDLYANKITMQTIQLLQGKPLKKLGLAFSMECTDEWLASLKKMPLESLNLQGCHQITDKGLEHIKDLQLKNLSLKYCMNISDEGLKNLQKMPLKTLDMEACDNITEAGLAHFSGVQVKGP